MFRSVFGRQDPPAQPQQQQQQPPPAHPPSATGTSPGSTSLNPLSRQGAEKQQGNSQAQAPYTQVASHGTVVRPSSSFPPQPLTNGAALGLAAAAPGRRHFPELANLSAEDLRVLLTDPVAYHKFLHKIEEVQQLDKVVEDLQKSDVELAKSTLAVQSTISELQTQCRIIRGTELASAQQHLQQLQARHHEVYSTLGPSALVARVQEGARVANKESDELQEKLAKGEMDMGAFIREYKEKRKEYHLSNQTALAALASLTS